MVTIKKCPECVKRYGVESARGVDGKCLECGAEFCAGHLLTHFSKVHFMQIEMESEGERDHPAKTGKE